jgi:signal transduction histidine kinase
MRLKVALIVVPTALAALVSAGFGVWSSAEQARAAGRTGELFAVARSAAVVTQRLQAERVAAAGVLVPRSGISAAVFERAVRQTDAAVVEFRRAQGGIAQVPPGVAGVLARAEAGLRDLDGARQRVRGESRVVLSAAVFGYRIVIAELDSLLVAVAQSGADPVVADEMRASAALARVRESVGLQQVAVVQALAVGRLTPALAQEIAAARAAHEDAMREFTGLARPQWRALAGRTLTGADVIAATRLEGAVSGTALYEPVRLPGGVGQWIRVMTARAALVADVQGTVDGDVAVAVLRVRHTQLRTVVVQAAVALLVVLLAVVTALRVARSMVIRLSGLERGARRVASVQLPHLVAELQGIRDPRVAQDLAARSRMAVALPVQDRDEVGRVADAFTSVFAAAVDAAGSQARLRANVGMTITSVARRLQRSVDGVLAGIDELERDETDTKRLAQVFVVDQRTTRLRRYAHGLLVVAGGRSRPSVREPVEVADLIKAALSEVEDYQRITVGALVEAEVEPRAVDALVHMLAELLDNATRFSAPQTPVLVTAQWWGKDLQITVEDTGIGMAGEQLAMANQVLASPPVEARVADQMGLLVTSRLAAELRVRVRLRPVRPAGTAAVMVVPAEYLTRVHVRVVERQPTAALPGPGLAVPARSTMPVPLTGTGWAAASGEPTAAGSGGQPLAGAAGSIAATMELPALGAVPDDGALGPRTGEGDPGSPLFQEMARKSPWLLTSTSDAAGGAGGGWQTGADAGWQAAAATAEPQTVGVTRSGLPKRRPAARVVPHLPAAGSAAGVGEVPVIDPDEARNQIAATMRGLRAANSAYPAIRPASTSVPTTGVSL